MVLPRRWTVWILLVYLFSRAGGSIVNNTNCSTTINTTSTISTNYSQCLEQEYAYDSCPDPSLCEPVNSGDNVGLAFGLTIAAGLSTTIGALLPFVPCIKRSNTLYLAAGLALAAGVMLYVSFTEIWTKSKWYFCCATPTHYDLVTAACFFGGIIITVLLDVLVSLLQKIDCGLACCCKKRSGDTEGKSYRFTFTNPLKRTNNNTQRLTLQTSVSSDISTVSNSIELRSPLEDSHSNQIAPSNDDAVSHGPSIGTCTSVLPSNNEQPGVDHLESVSVSVQSNGVSENTNNYAGASVNELFSNSSLLRMNAVIPEVGGSDSAIDVGGGDSVSSVRSEGAGIQGLVRRTSYLDMVDQTHEDSFEPQGPAEFKEVTEGLGKDAKKLHRMGILTGLAIAIHNFPEGLATFVATLSDPSLGVALCIAIAFHNIPEGVCVAMPVYYATGKRWKGFLWAFLSGISEPLGALLGWLVLKDVFGPLVYGIAFGLISGMMVFISIKELLPTARRFDTTGGPLVNGFLIAGMVVMAISLVLFLY